MALASDERGVLRALEFADQDGRLERSLARRYPTVALRRGAAPAAVADALERYFGGEIGALLEIEWALAGTDFQLQAWRALAEIPAGETRTYAQQAAAIGRPRAVRAVGAANGANPIGIVVPCHRVIGADGTLTGYGGGVDRKRWLLRHEGVVIE
jgi:methylated-DNA-[protein]-cysteine S-methyltransferase